MTDRSQQPSSLTPRRLKSFLDNARSARVLVVGDVMLDHFIWGTVARISPEAPVPIVEFTSESYMPGGAANVARNLSALGATTSLYSVVGKDVAAEGLNDLLVTQKVACQNLFRHPDRHTSIKTRIVAHRQQVVRVDRESKEPLDDAATLGLLAALNRELPQSDAVIVGDYGKGVVTQQLLDGIRDLCHRHGVWLSLDPKPVHRLHLEQISLITPNRKEAFELAGIADTLRHPSPLKDKPLLSVATSLLEELRPAVLLITLGELGMLLCQRGRNPFHIPTAAQEVFDVSGAGDTVIASFTLAIAAGASPIEAAIFSNHAAGVVVGKVGTATVTPEELVRSFRETAS